MPIVCEWYNNEKTIIYMKFTGKWSWSELPQIRANLIQMLNSVPHTVDYIADFSNALQIPSGALAVGRSIRSTRLANEGVALIVGSSPMLRMLYHSFTFAYPASKNIYLLVSSLEEAQKKLEEIQQKRDDKE